MYLTNRIILSAVLISQTIRHVYSGASFNMPRCTKKLRTNENNTAPYILPPTNTVGNESDLLEHPYSYIVMPNTTTVCWPNISKEFWNTAIHQDQAFTSKHHPKLKQRFQELNRNFNELILKLIAAADEIRGLVLYNNNDTVEELLKMEDCAQKETTTTTTTTSSEKGNRTNRDSSKSTSGRRNEVTEANDITKESPEEDSFTKSIMVPILLIIILMLLTYIAYLYRKLQFARYKDAQILVQDELIDPWATR